VVIRQGDVYWIDLDTPRGSGPGFRRPYLVLQNDETNDTEISTVIVCIVTSNLRAAEYPGNVQLARREAGLPRPSVANVSQLWTVDKRDLDEFSGRLSRARVREVLAGLDELLDPTPP
jgi:mRNA interferase MazF